MKKDKEFRNKANKSKIIISNEKVGNGKKSNQSIPYRAIMVDENGYEIKTRPSICVNKTKPTKSSSRRFSTYEIKSKAEKIVYEANLKGVQFVNIYCDNGSLHNNKIYVSKVKDTKILNVHAIDVREARLLKINIDIIARKKKGRIQAKMLKLTSSKLKGDGTGTGPRLGRLPSNK